MKRNQFLVVATTALAALLGVMGCGDNSHDCGTGTTLDDKGYCVPENPGSICGDGTKLEPATNTCVPDDSVCGGGTVLVNGVCQDPTGNLSVDLEEGPEPNGFEMGATPAGVVTPKPVGQGFVIHGCIRPVDGAADFDDYLVTVTEPTLLEITADGINGLAAGFAALGDPGDADPNIQNFQRYGVNVATDMSRRQLFLPKAGTYDLVLTDTRTLLPLFSGGNPIAAGDPNGNTTCYYVTVERQTPAPVALDTATGDTGTIGKDIKFYSATLNEGLVVIDAAINAAEAQPSLVVMDNNALRTVADGVPGAEALFGGIKSTDTPVIVLDYVFNYGLVPAPYTVDVVANLTAQPLSRGSQTTLNATSTGQQFRDASNNRTFGSLQMFYWDVTAAGQIDGIDITFGKPVQGIVIDQTGLTAANFTGLGGSATNPTTFTSYKGLLRMPAPGRYYFTVFVPRDPVGTAYTVVNRIDAQTPAAITLDTPLTAQPNNAYNSNAYTYSAGTEPWQLFNATGTNTGEVFTTLFDATTVVGRLDNLAVTTGTTTPSTTTVGSEPAPLFPPQGFPPPCPVGVLGAPSFVTVASCTFAFPADGSGPKGRLLPGGPTSFLVKINPAAPTGTPTFGLSVSTRAYTNLGTLADTSTTTRTGETIDTTTNTLDRFFFKTSPGNQVSITVTPVTAAMDPVIKTLNPDESAKRTRNVTTAGQAEVLSFAQDATGFTAFTVGDVSGPIAATYDLVITVTPPPYGVSTGTTAFVDACTGGTTVTMTAAGGLANDEGLSAAITPPTGFAYFGATAGNFLVSTNGFLTFDTTLTDATLSNADMPSALPPNGVIAPDWNDFENVVVCQKTNGTKLIIQWTGNVFFLGTPVQFQAILDGSNSTIELVYGAGQQETGTSSTVGVENLAGDAAVKLGFNQAVIAPSSSKLLTPQ